MSGKLIAIVLLASAVLAGASLYYLQIYGFYREVTGEPDTQVVLLSRDAETSVPIEATDVSAIDADSSPIRYRACFRTIETASDLAMRFEPLQSDVAPRNAPPWFDCFDAARLAAALADGTAQVFMGQKNVHYGVDRLVAISDDGFGYVWHELNECGTKAYDGTVIGEACPPRPGSE